MGTAYYMQPSFSGGEFDPKVMGRIDSERYATGLKQCENFYIHKFGSVSNRTGFLFLDNAKFSDKRCRLVPFVYSSDQSYVLEFGEHYIRFWNSDGTLILNGGVPLEVTTPYEVEDLRKLRFAQSADKVFIACVDKKPRVLSRESLNTWSFNELDYKYGPFLAQNMDDDITITPSDTSGEITLTASTDIFKSGHVGSIWRLDQNMSGETLSFTPTKSGVITSERFAEEDGYVLTTSETEWEGEISIQRGAYKGSPWGGTIYAKDSDFTWTTIWSKKHKTGDGVVRYTFTGSGGQHRIQLKSIESGNVTATVKNGNTTVRSISAQGASERAFTSGITCGAGSTWRLVTHGADWVGTIAVERSYDGGKTWMQLRSYTHRANEANFNVYADEPEQCLLRLFCKKLTTSGVNVTLSVDPFVNTGYVKITGYTSPTKVTAQVDEEKEIGNGLATNMWWEGAWSDVQGYPAAVCFYEDRLTFGGTKESPRSVWMSKAGDYNNFGTSSPTSEDDDSIQITLTSRKMSIIHALLPMRQSLMAFSEDGVNTISYADSSLTPSSVTQRAESYFGAKEIEPLTVGAQVIYVQEVGGSVRDIGYDYVQDAYSGDEISLFASNLVNRSAPVEMAYQQEPDSIVWFVREDGALLSCTYMREQKMVAWSHHTTQGQFESVCVIPYGNNARVWCSVKRTVNGADVRCIERMTLRLPTEKPEDQCYLDSAYAYDEDTATNTLSIPHLAGQTVRVVLDGNIMPDKVVAGDGTLTLERAGQKILVGLGYQSKLETLNIETQGFVRQGVMQGHKLQIAEVVLRLLHTRGGKVGSDEEHLDEWQRRTRLDFLGNAIDLYTGDVHLVGNFTKEEGGNMMLVQDVPMPFTLLAIMMGVKVSDG